MHKSTNREDMPYNLVVEQEPMKIKNAFHIPGEDEMLISFLSIHTQNHTVAWHGGN